MRVTFVLATADLSGGNRVISIYAERLARRGHHVTLAWRPHRLPTFTEKLRALAHRRPIPHRQKWTPTHLDRLRDTPNITCITINTYRPITAADLPDADVVIATWWETAEWIAAYPPAKGAKVYFLQGNEAIDFQPVDRVRATWRLPLQKITIARYLLDIAEQFGDRSAILVPNAVDLDQFHAPPRGKQPTPTIGTIYSFAPFKGFDIARAAYETARRQIPTLQLIGFGTHEPTPLMPIPPQMQLTVRPPQDQIRQLYASCDAWLIASRVEGFGLPLLESMACRTPVIATPAGAAPELLAHGGGVLVPMDNPAAMAQQIIRIATLPTEQWQAISNAAHATATRYTWDDATTLFEAALQRAVATAPA